MPRKVRDLLRELLAAGFSDRGGKGSHRNLKHPSGLRVTISGKPGDDARPYQEKAVARLLKEVAGDEEE